jgi:hypothetical protein
MSNTASDRFRRGLQQQSEWRSTNSELATKSITEFILTLIRPFVKRVVSGFVDWLAKLFS